MFGPLPSHLSWLEGVTGSVALEPIVIFHHSREMVGETQKVRTGDRERGREKFSG